MERGQISDPIPTDLIAVILSRLPAKSIARFRCLSKLWESILHRPYFTTLFLTRSRTRPRILFAVELNGKWSFFSLPQAQNPVYEKSSSLVVAADFHIKVPRDRRIYPSYRKRFSYGYTSGLIYFSSMRISKEPVPMVCNPITGHYVILPKLGKYRNSYIFLGFDPIDKQFKVLSMGCPGSGDGDDHRILTLGNGKLRWRKIQCPIAHEPTRKGICINGVLYYLVRDVGEIVCFDVRSEKFKFINAEHFRYWSDNLINYKGKLGGISLEYVGVDGFKLHMCILEDVEKQEWSEHVYTLSGNEVWSKLISSFRLNDSFDLGEHNVFAVQMTSTGEIVLWEQYRCRIPFYVFYFNPERNTLLHVEIQGIDENRRTIYTFVDHVEDLNFNDAKLLMSSISAPSVKNKQIRQSSWRTSMNR